MTLDIDAIEALAGKATKGPWKTHTVDDTCIMSDQYDVATTCDSSNAECAEGYNVEYERMETDAAFIAASREVVPALIAEVRRLREALVDAAAHLAGASSAYAKHAGRSKSIRPRGVADPFYMTRVQDFDAATSRARKALGAQS